MIQTVLAVETSTKACSIALYHQNRFYELEEKTNSFHGKTILPMVHEVLRLSNCDRKQIHLIAFGQGPGSFTGLRIGIGVVQGLAFGFHCNTIPISSLLALAETAFLKTGFPFILAGLDARMGEIYYGAFVFQEQNITTLVPETVLKPDEVLIPDISPEWLAVGSGFDQYGTTFQQKNHKIQHIPNLYPSAVAVARLSLMAQNREKITCAEKAMPMYLRGI